MASNPKRKPLTTKGHIRRLSEDILNAAEKLISQYKLDSTRFALTISANIQPTICDVMVCNVDGSNSHSTVVKLESAYDPFKNETYIQWLKDFLKKSKYGLKTVEHTGRYVYTFTQ